MPLVTLDPEIYCLPVLDRFLLYSPLRPVAALVDGTAIRQMGAALSLGQRPAIPLQSLFELLMAPSVPAPAKVEGPFVPPFLGIIPTRACNLACRYCGFWHPQVSQAKMDLGLVRRAVDW